MACQMSIDSTLVSPIRGDGEPRHLCVDHDGAALAQARRRKQRTCPELGGQGRARLAVLAAEVGGRWSEEARAFVSQLDKAKAMSVPRDLAGRARQAWQHRCAFVLSLLDRRLFVASDGVVPCTSAVITACRHLPPGVLRWSCLRVCFSRQ